MDKVRIGVLGTGVIMRDYHVPLLVENPRAELVAAGNLHPDSLAALAQDFGIPKTYTDFDQMAGQAGIDAIVIGLPNQLHAPATIRMLRSGKHVLCEKPMATTVTDAQAMVEAADASGRKLMIAHMWRYDPEIRWLRQVVQSGVLGRIFKIKAQNVWIGEGPTQESWFVRPEIAGGGALIDMAVHPIDTISFLFGDTIRATRVFTQLGAYFQPIEVEDTANIVIEYDDGMAALIESGWYHDFADGPEGTVQVFGTEGYARVFPSELHCKIGGAWGQYNPDMPVRRQQCDLPMYAAQLDRFIDCVLGNAEPEPDGRQGLKSVRVLEAAYRSGHSGESVTLGE
jgi:predicted dehydrogenase